MSRARVHAYVISIVSPPVSTDLVEAGMHAFKPHSISLQIQNYLEPAISAIRAERESVVAPSSESTGFSPPARHSRKSAPRTRCRSPLSRCRVGSRPHPAWRRCAPRFRRPPTALSLLMSPNWRLAELHNVSRSTQAREQRLSGPTLLIASSWSTPAVASEQNNYRSSPRPCRGRDSQVSVHGPATCLFSSVVSRVRWMDWT